MSGSLRPNWVRALIGVGVAVLACIVLVSILMRFLGISLTRGDYRVVEVTIASDEPQAHAPDAPPIFGPLDTVRCIVRTEGVDGIIGMRWIRGDELLNETIGKTVDNSIVGYMAGSPSNPIPEGDYRVEVFLVEDPVATGYFTVKGP